MYQGVKRQSASGESAVIRHQMGGGSGPVPRLRAPADRGVRTSARTFAWHLRTASNCRRASECESPSFIFSWVNSSTEDCSSSSRACSTVFLRKRFRNKLTIRLGMVPPIRTQADSTAAVMTLTTRLMFSLSSVRKPAGGRCFLNHSYRSAAIGSRRMARRAGT